MWGIERGRKYPKLITVHGLSCTAFATLLALQLPGPPRTQIRGGRGRDCRGESIFELDRTNKKKYSETNIQTCFCCIPWDYPNVLFLRAIQCIELYNRLAGAWWQHNLWLSQGIFFFQLCCWFLRSCAINPGGEIIFLELLPIFFADFKYHHETWIPCRNQQTLCVFCWSPEYIYLKVPSLRWLLCPNHEIKSKQISWRYNFVMMTELNQIACNCFMLELLWAGDVHLARYCVS